MSNMLVNMSDPWVDLLPTAATSVVTTLVTLGVTGGVQKYKREREYAKAPLVLQKRGFHWFLVNRSRKPVVNMHIYVSQARESTTAPVPGTESVLLPRHSLLVGQDLEGAVVTFTWASLVRNRIVDQMAADVLVKPDIDSFDIVGESAMYGK